VNQELNAKDEQAVLESSRIAKMREYFLQQLEIKELLENRLRVCRSQSDCLHPFVFSSGETLR
jgi:hypothetical protein